LTGGATRRHHDDAMRPRRATIFALAVSAAWIAGAAIAVRYADLRAAKFLRNGAFEVCDYVGYRLFAWPDCWRDLMAAASALDTVFADLALLALAPVVLAWLAALCVRTLRRWARGFAVRKAD
jgi:hypothetical protein